MKFLLLMLFLFSFSFLISQTPEIIWKFDTNDSSFGQSALGDIDGDGKDEMVFGCYRNDSCIYALNSEDGSLLWKFNTTDYQEGCNDSAPIIFDIDKDGKLDVIVISSCNPFAYCFDGETGTTKWKALTRGSDSPPVIADFNGDGYHEIAYGTFGGYVVILNGIDGTLNREILVDSNSWIQTAPTVVDLNSDGQLDFVVSSWSFSQDNKIYAYNGLDFSLLWKMDLSGYVYHGTAVADIDNDGNPELVVGDYGGILWVFNGKNGNVKWKFNSGAYIGSPAVIGDLNSDGNCEVIFTSASKLYALNNNNTVFWEYNIPDNGQAFRGVVISDINNNDNPDVIFGTSNGYFIGLDGLNGKELWKMDLKEDIGKAFDINHSPVIADFNKDGKLDAFLVGGFTNYPDFSMNYGRAYAITLGEGAGPEWKMFQQNIYRTSSICGLNTNVNHNNENFSSEFTIDYQTETISYYSTEENLLFKIYNLEGALVQSVFMYSGINKICFAKLIPGVYLCIAENSTFKFIKY